VYNTLFNYYYNSEVSKSAVYMEKWLANSDDDGMSCYYRASMKLAEGRTKEVITKCDECLSSGGASAPLSLYSLKALAQFKTGDSLGSKTTYEEYFKKQVPAKVGAREYFGYANALLKFPNNEDLAASFAEKAIALDSLETGKVDYLKAIANAYRAIKNYNASATWYNRLLNTKKNYNNVDIYNAGIDYFNCNKFDSSVIVFNKYIAKYPEEINGYYLTAVASSRLDSTMTTGQAAEAYVKLIEVCEKATDKAKVKDKLIDAYAFMLQYTFNIKKDQPAAIAYADKALALDPANAESIKNKEFVTKNNPNSVRPNAPARPTVPAKTVPAKSVPAKTVPAKPTTTKPAVVKPPVRR
jgi:tetratricopeptide (TPR) repeat protein